MNKYIKHLVVNNRNIIVFTHDLIVIALSWISAFLIRFNFEIPEAHFISMISNLWLVLIVQGIIFLIFKVHRASWRYSSISDVITITITILLSSLVLAGYFLFYYENQPVIPRSIILVNPLLLLLIMIVSFFYIY